MAYFFRIHIDTIISFKMHKEINIGWILEENDIMDEVLVDNICHVSKRAIICIHTSFLLNNPPY